MALEVPVAVLCCCFRDDKALGSSSDAVQDQERAAASALRATSTATRNDDPSGLGRRLISTQVEDAIQDRWSAPATDRSGGTSATTPWTLGSR